MNNNARGRDLDKYVGNFFVTLLVCQVQWSVAAVGFCIYGHSIRASQKFDQVHIAMFGGPVERCKARCEILEPKELLLF